MEHVRNPKYPIGTKVYSKSGCRFPYPVEILAFKPDGFGSYILTVKDEHGNECHINDQDAVSVNDAIFVVTTETTWEDGSQTRNEIITKDIAKAKAKMQSLIAKELDFEKNESNKTWTHETEAWSLEEHGTTWESYVEGWYSYDHFVARLYIGEIE